MVYSSIGFRETVRTTSDVCFFPLLWIPNIYFVVSIVMLVIVVIFIVGNNYIPTYLTNKFSKIRPVQRKWVRKSQRLINSPHLYLIDAAYYESLSKSDRVSYATLNE